MGASACSQRDSLQYAGGRHGPRLASTGQQQALTCGRPPASRWHCAPRPAPWRPPARTCIQAARGRSGAGGCLNTHRAGVQAVHHAAEPPAAVRVLGQPSKACLGKGGVAGRPRAAAAERRCLWAVAVDAGQRIQHGGLGHDHAVGRLGKRLEQAAAGRRRRQCRQQQERCCRRPEHFCSLLVTTSCRGGREHVGRGGRACQEAGEALALAALQRDASQGLQLANGTSRRRRARTAFPSRAAPLPRWSWHSGASSRVYRGRLIKAADAGGGCGGPRCPGAGGGSMQLQRARGLDVAQPLLPSSIEQRLHEFMQVVGHG